MSVIAAALRELIAAGLSGEALVAAVERIEAAAPSLADAAAEKRRAWDRERKRRVRNVHPSPVESGGNADISRARVEDNNLSTEVTGNHTTPDFAWPLANPPAKADLDALEAVLRAEASPAVDPTATRLCILSPILRLGHPGTGPPCDLHADILPVIRARAKSARRHSVKSWDFFTAAILEARDRRLQDLPNVEILDARRPQQPARSDKFERRHRNYAAALAGAEAASRERAQRG